LVTFRPNYHYVILNNGRNHGPITPFSRRWEKGWGERSEGGGAGSVRCKKRDFCSTSLSLALSRLRERGFVLQFHPTSIGVAGNITQNRDASPVIRGYH